MSKLTKILIIDAEDDTPIGKNYVSREPNSFINRHNRVEALNKTNAIKALSTLGAASVRIAYSGCGDGGQIDEVNFMDANGQLIEFDTNIDIGEYSLVNNYANITETDIPKQDYVNFGSVRVERPYPRPEDWKDPEYDDKAILKQAADGTLDKTKFNVSITYYEVKLANYSRSPELVAENLAYALLQLHGHGSYEVDDGGAGTVTYDFTTKTGKIEHQDYYTAAEESNYDFAA